MFVVSNALEGLSDDWNALQELFSLATEQTYFTIQRTAIVAHTSHSRQL